MSNQSSYLIGFPNAHVEQATSATSALIGELFRRLSLVQNRILSIDLDDDLSYLQESIEEAMEALQRERRLWRAIEGDSGADIAYAMVRSQAILQIAIDIAPIMAECAHCIWAASEDAKEAGDGE